MNKFIANIDSLFSDIIIRKDLSLALNDIKDFVKFKGVTKYDNRLEDVESGYNLMKDYMSRGYKDEMRESLYFDMLRKLYTIAFDLSNDILISEGSYYFTSESRTLSLNEENISARLEGFVQEIAMASLQPDSIKVDLEKKVIHEHQIYLSVLFDAIIVSPYWNEGICNKMTETLLNPMLDTSDILNILSGITLSSTYLFDYWRFKTLYNVFLASVDENIRQRAFVGWAFLLNTYGITLFKEATNLFNDALKSTAIDLRHQLYELQLQVIYCSDAEQDNENIQKNIMPDLLRNGNFKITKSGIVETEEESIDDIIHSDEEDKKMEQIEKGFNKMKDMQKQGSDIYFGGFSQMKRFPFFSKINNWFAPFDIDSPFLSDVRAKLGKINLLDALYRSNTFCDSDKYSFAFAIVSVLDQIPENMREMMNSADFFGMTLDDDSDSQSPTYIRRRYLQDLYRFFKLNQYKKEFNSPFLDANVTGLKIMLLTDFVKYEEFSTEILSLAKFALKHHRWNLLDVLLSHFKLTEDLVKNKLDYETLKWHYYLMGALFMHRQMYVNACDAYKSLLIVESLQKSNFDRNELSFNPTTEFVDFSIDYIDLESCKESVLKSYALSALRSGDNSLAAKCYKILSEKNSLFKYKLYYAIALIGMDNTDGALTILFPLDLEYDDAKVKRTIAWALLVKRDYEKSENYYDKLLLSDSIVADDYLNAGYCKWILNKNSEAVILFKNWMSTKKSDDTLSEAFNSDNNILNTAGISNIDMKLMIDIVSE